MLEVEVKLRLHDPDALRARLTDWSPKGVVRQRDVYFQHPGRDFVQTDEALRVRTVDGAHKVTYKGPRRKAAVKVREEVEHAIEGDPTRLLEALGFRGAGVVEKRRETWHRDGVELAIDDVVGLGMFVEVEAQSDDAEAASDLVESALRDLGLESEPRIEGSYLSLQ